MGNKGKIVLMVQAIEKQHTAVVLLYLILGILLFSITFMILQEPYIRCLDLTECNGAAGILPWLSVPMG